MKRTFTIIAYVAYLLFLFAALAVFIKPGASIFYRTLQISPHTISSIGEAYEFSFDNNLKIFNPESVIFREAGKPLDQVFLREMTSGEDAIFALKEISGQKINILFIPSDFSNPTSNGRNYQVLIRPYFIQGNFGGFVVGLLILGLLTFLKPLVSDRHKRKLFLSSPFDIDSWRITTGDKSDRLDRLPRTTWVKHAFFNISLIAFLYVFMEWIFLITKSSFMDQYLVEEKLSTLLVTGLMAAILGLLTLPVIIVLDLIISIRFSGAQKHLYPIPSAILASCLSLILLDNFTYTIFKFGIVNSNLFARLLYMLIFVGFFAYYQRTLVPERKKSSARLEQVKTIPVAMVFTLSVILAAFSYNPLIPSTEPEQNTGSPRKPNIIFLCADGINASNMSVYGYARDTTPFLSEFGKTSLISMNHFTNGAGSTTSEIAVLTGKSPLTVKVLNAPMILKGSDMFEHLPGLLKAKGYRTVSVAVPGYVDANTANFQNAFDVVNGQEKTSLGISNFLASKGYTDEIYFLTNITDRIGDRIKHIFFIEDMKDVHATVTEGGGFDQDKQRLQDVLMYLKEAWESEQPIFVHVHLLATHGPKFHPNTQVFSLGKEEYNSWMTDFYDDAILAFDSEVESLIDTLKENGQYENTLLVIYTDHGKKWATLERLPLIIHFPQGEHAGVLTANTQNIDITPTILDYLGIKKPDWIEGVSMLGDISPNRLTITGYPDGELNTIQCQNFLIFGKSGSSVKTGQIENFVNPCPESTLDSQDAIRKKLFEFINKRGYTNNGW